MNDPATWASFEAALAAHEAGLGNGIGFVFSTDDEYVGIDLDNSIDPETGKLKSWAARIVRDLASYTEVSPSGSGVHVIVRGKLRGARHKKPCEDGIFEAYDQGHYFTFTGRPVEGTGRSIENRDQELERLYRSVFGAEGAGVAAAFETPRVPLDLDDAGLILRALAAKTGTRFRCLWLGDTQDYPSHSEADLALCGMLAFWTDGDAKRMDRVFRRSHLYRDKWDELHYADGRTYGQATIQKALSGATGFYSSSPPSGANGNGHGEGGGETETAPATVRPELSKVSVSLGDLMRDTSQPPPSVIGEGLLRPHQFGAFYAPSGTGKTWVGLDLPLACITGGSWFGIQCRRVRCGYVSLELEKWDVRDRLKVLCATRGIDWESVQDDLYIIAPPDLEESVDVLDPAWQDMIVAWAQSHGLELVILDTLTEAHSGDEMDYRPVIKATRRIARLAGCALLYIHHSRKKPAGSRPGASSGADDMRGDSRLLGAARLVVSLETKDASGDLLRLAIEKVNTGKRPLAVWLRREESGVLSLTEAPQETIKKGKRRMAQFLETVAAAGSEGCSASELAEKLGVGERTVERYAKKAPGVATVGRGKATRYLLRSHLSARAIPDSDKSRL